jgi:hypothetical protein
MPSIQMAYHDKAGPTADLISVVGRILLAVWRPQ